MNWHRTLAFGTFLIVLAGCASYPRYRSGGPERPVQVLHPDTSITTNDYLRLGLILREYLGKPYQGVSRYVEGIDCSLFTRDVFEKFDNVDLPRTVDGQYQTGREISRHRLLYGDLVFFKTEPYRVSHVGIYVGYNQFVHASSTQGVIISGMDEKYWSERYAGARRVLNNP